MLTVIRRTWYALYFDRRIHSAANGGIDVLPHELVMIGNQPKHIKGPEIFMKTQTNLRSL